MTILLLAFLLGFSAPAPGQALDLPRTAALSRSRGAALPAVVQRYANRTASLNLRGDFSRPGGPQRAVWDIPLRLDLSQTSAVKLRFRTVDSAAVRQFDLYVDTGSGWYAAAFQPSSERQWEELVVPKSRFVPEGAPQSWQDCRTLRIAAWKSAPRAFQLQIAHLEMLRPNLSLGLLRGGGSPERIRDAYLYARILGSALARRGLYPAVLESGDCTARVLYPYSLLLLPYPESLTPGQTEAVGHYLRSGRHIGAFYTLSPLLASAFEQPVGRFLRSADLDSPLAGIQPSGRLLPGARPFRQDSQAAVAVVPTSRTRVLAWWLDARRRNTGIPAILQGPRGFWMTHVYLDHDFLPGTDTLLSLIELYLPSASQTGAAALLNFLRFNLANQPRTPRDLLLQLQAAERRYHARQFHPAAHLCLACEENLRRSEILPETPAPPDEFRAAWIRDPAGFPGLTWQQTAAELRRKGFNAVFPNFASCHSCSYDSGILPGGQGADRVRECLQACRRQDLRLHFWLSCFGAGDAPSGWLEAMRRQGRLAVDEKGAALAWLCPSQPGNRQLLAGIVREALQRYPLDGLHLDLVRYAGSASCLCPACRAGFQGRLGGADLRWPEDVLPGGRRRQAWLSFRVSVLDSFVSQIRALCRSIRPGLLLSAAVYPDLAQSAQGVGQDWGRWLLRRDVDFVCPMNYTDTTRAFQDLLTRQAPYRTRLVPGIGATPNRLSPEAIHQQILAVRQARTPGFILFEMSPHLALPALQP